MTTQEQFAKVVESYKGTRFWPNGREPGVGLDCVGIVACALTELGIPFKDSQDYLIRPGSDYSPLMRECFASALVEVTPSPLQIGDVIAVNRPYAPAHCGVVVSARTFVHAIAGGHKTPPESCGVVETLLGYEVLSRITSVWRLP